MADLNKLRLEILNDELGRGYASMSDQQIANSLALKNVASQRPLSSAELLGFTGGNGRRAKLKAFANGSGPVEGYDDATVAAVRNVAEVAMVFLDRDNTELDLTRPDRMGMVNALVPLVWSAADRDALVAMAATSISRAEQLGLGEVHAGDVHAARS